MRTLIWRLSAADQLDDIIGYIADRSPIASYELEARVKLAAERLCESPFIGRPGRLAGTREMIVHPNYIMIYTVSETFVTVLRVLHARQQYP
ncbi:MAG: type II toxin-antitoxin system RelE/ParE family toxin [Sphingorhabdus sp.]